MAEAIKSPVRTAPVTQRVPAPQMQIRSGVRAGGAGGPCDTAYWRSELNYWRNLAQQMGCA